VLAIIIIPLLLGIVTLFIRSDEHRSARRRLLILGALFHNFGSLAMLSFRDLLTWGSYIKIDGLGLVFLLLMSFLFTLVSFYSLGYFPLKRKSDEHESGGHIYVSCMLFFLTAMTIAISTAHVGILWIAIEGTTLASAPLIYYRQSKRSLEAAWKYLLICSVGIAIALLGIFFIAASTRGTGAELSLASLTAHAKELDPRLLRMGFILVLIGFGTKMGLAPMHNWLPDAHSEAPSPISALLSGTLLNCALLGIIRFYQICVSAGLAEFAGRLLVIFGLVSLFVSAVFIAYQKDYKRLLAHSSIEHMGIIALGIGIGADFASLLHVVGHSLTKALLFMVAGNILILYRTKMVSEVGGLLRTSPSTGALFVIGGLAIVGAPPFLPFISEFLILREGIATGHPVIMGLYLLSLGIIFVSMTRSIFRMSQGNRRELIWGELPKLIVVPPMVLAVAVIGIGLYLPKQLATLLGSAANLLKML
jgi:hydrogenase-4 component F